MRLRQEDKKANTLYESCTEKIREIARSVPATLDADHAALACPIGKSGGKRVIKDAKYPTQSYLNQIAFTEKSSWESFRRLRAWAKANVAQ